MRKIPTDELLRRAEAFAKEAEGLPQAGDRLRLTGLDEAAALAAARHAAAGHAAAYAAARAGKDSPAHRAALDRRARLERSAVLLRAEVTRSELAVVDPDRPFDRFYLLHGRVLDAAGAGLGGLTVRALDAAGAAAGSAETDERGYFRLALQAPEAGSGLHPADGGGKETGGKETAAKEAAANAAARAAAAGEVHLEVLDAKGKLLLRDGEAHLPRRGRVTFRELVVGATPEPPVKGGAGRPTTGKASTAKAAAAAKPGTAKAATTKAAKAARTAKGKGG